MGVAKAAGLSTRFNAVTSRRMLKRARAVKVFAFTGYVFSHAFCPLLLFSTGCFGRFPTSYIFVLMPPWNVSMVLLTKGVLTKPV